MEDYRVKAVVLAAGVGTRLRPLTATTPKCLVQVGGRPLLHYWLTRIQAAGINEVLINTHHLAARVREFLSAYRTDGFQITEFFEPVLLGSAGTIGANPDFMDHADHCVIIYADNFSDVDLSLLVSSHVASTAECTMLLFEAPEPTQCGIVELDGRNYVTSFEEKPVSPRSNLANGGVYVVSAAVYREIAKMDAFDLGYHVLPRLAGRIQGFVHTGYHQDIGSMESLVQVNEYLVSAR